MNDALNQADRTIHSLAQFIALTSMQWLPQLPDDSQTNMAWNPIANQLAGRDFTVSGSTFRLVIQLDDFALHFVDDQERPVASFFPEGHTPNDASVWWHEQMKGWGISEIRQLNYQLEAPVSSQTIYERPEALADWMYRRTLANSTLQQLNEWSDRESEIRIWPHHFDTGVYYTLTDAIGKERAAIWAGYAIADSVCPEPYFYISGYSSNQPIDFSSAPVLSCGEWRIGADWKGALLPISAIKTTDSIPLFFRQAYAWLNQETA